MMSYSYKVLFPKQCPGHVMSINYEARLVYI